VHRKKLNLCFFCLIFFIILQNPVFSQYSIDFTCGSNTLLATPTIHSTTTLFEGYIKPNRTDTINGAFTSPLAYFPVLIVFVQFKDDASTDVWPNVSDTSGPTYKNTMIATEKSYNTNWWEAYNANTQTISDYFLQASRDKMHVIGDAYSIVLDSNASYYRTIGEAAMTNEIWKKLNRFYSIDWLKYDKWGWDDANNTFKYGNDSIVDFIYKIHKTTGNGVLSEFSGYAGLGGGTVDYVVDTVNHIRINHGYGILGSGITAARNQIKDRVFETVSHEHAHYTYSGGHTTYSRLCYGVGFDNSSPYDEIYNRYMTPRDATFGQTNSLGDFSSRNSGNGEIIKVPISETEFFLLASRRKVSTCDRVMFGDTAFYNAYNNLDYGKGLYIYHVFNGIQTPAAPYSVYQDMESADGYYRWDTIGKQSVYMDCWTSDPTWWVYKKAEVLYTNDPSELGTDHFKGDELSLHHFIGWSNGYPSGMTVKFSVGQIADDNCHLGTDKLYTNTTEYYPNYNNSGTRWDPWNVGYNEVFSPYSSPSTKDKNDNESGIFIYYKALTSKNTASIDIYKVNQPLSRDSILKLTPPSRPMGLKIGWTNCTNNEIFVKLTWNHNMEPDMLRNSTFKRYQIYRAYADMDNVLGDYTMIAEWNFSIDSTPTYIDYNVWANCDYSASVPHFNVRYKIKAVDNTDWTSVFSDFVSNQSLVVKINTPDNYTNNSNLPNSFNLYQNYPNPFNPETNIQYDLPKDVFVSIKIYDLLGREIKTLVNEFKNAGSYIVSFNGSEFASGIYFYKIKAENFVQVKRMVLIK
jgi:hypothetical protein